MKTLMGVALFGLTLLIACSTNPRAIPALTNSAFQNRSTPV